MYLAFATQLKMLAEFNWGFAFPASIFGTICLSISFVLCVCGWRTKQPKDDLAGVEGRVKITNPEDYQEEVNANNITADLVSDKVQNSAKRSLPDLPVDSQGTGRNDVSWEPNGDAASELYATVVLQDEKNKKHNRQKSDSDSASQTTANTYAKMKKDHPYDKLKKVEHPYAQVKDSNSEKRSSSTSHINNVEEEGSSNQEFEGEILSSARPGNESSGNIPAATAITGHVSASEDLPYMTPPAHFSGDSQDSGKGYTSISVREPLSAIRGESKAATRQNDPHYATVSDDSDDMYAAIDDPSQVYTSESETYAQIHNGSNRPKSAPQPPSVDSLKQMTVSSHSRQASCSSLASSTVISSPKPEKRPANSPLPPTPTKSPESVEDLYQTADKSSRQSGSPRNIEDMYAKVNKKVRREADLEKGGSTESGVSESSDSLSFKLQTSSTESNRSCHSYSSKSTLTHTPTTSSNGPPETTESFSSETDLQAGYEKLGASNSFEFDRKSDPGYETLNKRSESDPEYEKLKPKNHGYVNVVQTGNPNSGFEGKVESDLNDGYARVKAGAQENDIYSKIDACESDDYSKLEKNNIGTGEDGYAKVLKHKSAKGEPNYEKVRFGDKKESENAGEPTYESLGNEFDDPNDPNYESVRFLQNSGHMEPPYQLLRECESGTTGNGDRKSFQ